MILFQQQDFSRSECKYGNSGICASIDGFWANAGDVEAKVVVGFGDFRSNCAAGFASELAAAKEALVGAFESFDGENRAVFDDGKLADVEAGGFVGDVESELDIIELIAGGFGAKKEVFTGHDALEPWSGFDELDSLFLKFAGDAAEDGVGVFVFEGEEEFGGAKVRAEVEEVFGGDLADHDALGDAAGGEGVDEFGELADAEPNDFIDKGGELGVGFVFKSGSDEVFDASGAGFAGEGEGE